MTGAELRPPLDLLGGPKEASLHGMLRELSKPTVRRTSFRSIKVTEILDK